MLKPKFTGQFKKDYKQALKRGCDSDKLWEVITMLANREPLPVSKRDHALTDSRTYKNMRECHVEPDWLLIYKIETEIMLLKLVRTGSHSDLF